MSTSQSIRFCNYCDNKYYHKIDEKNDLIYYCRVCGIEDATITTKGLCVLDTQFESISGENKQFDHLINRYTKLDPTLPHIHIPCPNLTCSTKTDAANPNKLTDAVYLRYDDNAMKHLYICTICDFTWKSN